MKFIVQGYPAYAYTGSREFDPKLPSIVFVHGATEGVNLVAQTLGRKVVEKGDEIVDVLFDGDGFCELSIGRVDTPHTHGTGCSFASAIAAALAKGASLVDAVAQAQAYVSGAAAHALALGHGRGPLDHFWRQRAARGSD